MLLGITMLLNVWGVIWQKQKIVLAYAAHVLAGGEADPEPRPPVARRCMASVRTPMFSVTMMLFMVVHVPLPVLGVHTVEQQRSGHLLDAHRS